MALHSAFTNRTALMAVVTRIEPLSLAKVFGILYAVLGLLYGAMLAAFGSIFAAMGGPYASIGGLGIGALIGFPIFFAVTGFIGGLIMGALYNLVAGWVGGVEVEVDGEGVRSIL